jgi:hypothetical protein
MSSPWPEDYYTPVAEMDTNHILKSTLTGESRQQKGESRICLFCGFSYFFRPIRARYHLGLGNVSKKVQMCKPTLDAQTSPSGCRPISWEMHQLQRWSGTNPSFVIVSKKCIVVDGIVANRTVPARVAYKDIPLDITPETEAVRYLGFWATPNGNMQVAMQLVMDRTLRAKETIQGHPLGP